MMFSDLPLADQFWHGALVLAVIVVGLAVIVLLGPAWLREARAIFREDTPTAATVARLMEFERRKATMQLVAPAEPRDDRQADAFHALMLVSETDSVRRPR